MSMKIHKTPKHKRSHSIVFVCILYRVVLPSNDHCFAWDLEVPVLYAESFPITLRMSEHHRSIAVGYAMSSRARRVAGERLIWSRSESWSRSNPTCLLWTGKWPYDLCCRKHKVSSANYERYTLRAHPCFEPNFELLLENRKHTFSFLNFGDEFTCEKNLVETEGTLWSRPFLCIRQRPCWRVHFCNLVLPDFLPQYGLARHLCVIRYHPKQTFSSSSSSSGWCSAQVGTTWLYDVHP